MAKIFGYYSNDLDKTWYSSSNIVYSECDDHDDKLKTLRIVFSNGTQYQYNNVNVNDYLLFRQAKSQGTGLNKFIKSRNYEYEKLENADIDKIKEELDFRTGNGIFVEETDKSIIIKDTEDSEILTINKDEDINLADLIEKIYTSVGYVVKKEKKNDKA